MGGVCSAYTLQLAGRLDRYASTFTALNNQVRQRWKADYDWRPHIVMSEFVVGVVIEHASWDSTLQRQWDPGSGP